MKKCLKDGIAVQGYDVVEFFNGKGKKGSEKYTVDFDGGKYFFTSNENKEKFLENPDEFRPQYGGFCAMAMTKGEDIRPNPKCFSIEDGKLYFFTRVFFGLLDAKKQWVNDCVNKKLSADKAWKKLNV